MFRIADLVVIIIFFAGITGIGVYFARKNDSTEEYFLGNRSFPGWVIGLSMLGTSISSVSFLALPAAAFILDYRQAVNNLALPVAAILAVFIFIPFFRQGKATSAFEYLEQRYCFPVRLYAAAGFIILQVIRLATILYLVAIPIAEMTGMHIIWIIIFGGVFISFYTVLGGIEAVIWTDVAQTIILLLGGILCLTIIVFSLPGGLGQIIDVGSGFHKFSLGPMEWGFSKRTFWVMLLLGLTGFTTEYSSNQNVVQRYIAAKSTKEARKATIICAVTAIPTWMMFFFLGTCLFVFYKAFPDPKIIGMKADEVLPYFILSKTYPGVGGLIIAACIAAAMSSLDSSINAVATIGTVDFFKRLDKKERTDKEYLSIARKLSITAGVLMIAGSVVINYIPKESINDFTLIVSSLFGGGMLAIFMLGFFTRRVGNTGIITGLIVGLIFNIYMVLHAFGVLPQSLTLGIHAYWSGIIMNFVLCVVAIGVSLFKPEKRSLAGLTVWTNRKPCVIEKENSEICGSFSCQERN